MTAESFVQDEFYESLLVDFLDESGGLVDRLNEDLLRLEEIVGAGAGGEPDLDLLNQMFRSAHSMKGLSAMLGLERINRLTHRIENIFDAFRHGELRADAHSVETLFVAIDALTALIDAVRDSGGESGEIEHVIERIESVLSDRGGEPKTSGSPSTDATAPRDEATAKCARAEPVAHAADIDLTQVKPAALAPNPLAGISDETEVPEKYLSIFIDETEMTLDGLSGGLLTAEADPASADVATLLILAHRIKGSAASIGLLRPARVAHLMEDILQIVRDEQRALSAEHIDVFLRSVDALRGYVQKLRTGSDEPSELMAVAADLKTVFSGIGEGSSEAPLEANSPVAPPPSPQPLVEATGSTVEAYPLDDAFLETARREARESGVELLAGRIALTPGQTLSALKAELLIEKLSRGGDLHQIEPNPETLGAEAEVVAIRFLLQPTSPISQIEAAVSISGVDKVCLRTIAPEPVAATVSSGTDAASELAPSQPRPAPPDDAAPDDAAPPNAAPAPSQPEAKREPNRGDSNRPGETMRVDVDRLDELMNLAGQLVINKARFRRVSDQMRDSVGARDSTRRIDDIEESLRRLAAAHQAVDGKTLAAQLRRVHGEVLEVQREFQSRKALRSAAAEFEEAVHQLERVSGSIQRSVMETRMTPIGPLFHRFRRVVRDAERACEKQIQLQIIGEATELDKRMIDELGDPLIHLVRNAVDHGIELPAQRQAAGKSPRGLVTLEAAHRGNSIVITVRDDGKGLNADRILAKAIHKGLIQPGEAERLTLQETFQLIWQPGFSTAEQVTEISGRGMGMDIVRSKIEDLNGSVEVDSTPGAGATFSIRLPLTLAILPSLLARIDGDTLAIPIEDVVEIVSTPEDEIRTVHGRETARVREDVVSIVQLCEIFQWNRRPAVSERIEHRGRTLVILGRDREKVALQVDGLIGEQDVVIKSLADNFRNVPGVSGASILGDGRVSLILDVGALLQLARN